MEIRDRKAAQRRAGIMARRDLPQAERAAANAAICARLLAMPCFQKADIRKGSRLSRRKP